MISIIRTHDMGLVKSIYTHSKIYSKIADDFCPPANEVEIEDYEGKYFLIPYDEAGNATGIICFYPHNYILYHVHIAFLPEFWGKSTPESIKAALSWIKKHTLCKKVIGIIPTQYRLVIRLAKLLGFKKEGHLKNSVQINQTLQDLEIYGLELWMLDH